MKLGIIFTDLFRQPLDLKWAFLAAGWIKKGRKERNREGIKQISTMIAVRKEGRRAEMTVQGQYNHSQLYVYIYMVLVSESDISQANIDGRNPIVPIDDTSH